MCLIFQRPLHGFQAGMKLEAVDKRNPMLIRVATISDTDDHRVKVNARHHSDTSELLWYP